MLRRTRGHQFNQLTQEPSLARRVKGRTREQVMPDARYFIVQHDDLWSIKFNDEEYGPYKTKDEAMLFAIDAAQKLGEYGDNAQVVLMGEDGHFHAEWIYGRDSVPARSEERPPG
jgi:hypothetical protein